MTKIDQLVKFTGGRFNSKDPAEHAAYMEWSRYQRRRLKHTQYLKYHHQPKGYIDPYVPGRKRKTHNERFCERFGELLESYHAKVEAHRAKVREAG